MVYCGINHNEKDFMYTATYEDFRELFTHHPELEHELRSIILERMLTDRNLEVLRLTDLTEALQAPTPDVDPDGDIEPPPE